MAGTNELTLKKSLDWIRQHPNACNLDVPSDLLERWVFDADEDEQKPTGFCFSVFSFGYLQHKVLTSCVRPDQQCTVPLSRLLAHFEMWQLKLGLVEIHRKTNLRVAPMPLFTFPDGEEVRYWLNTNTHPTNYAQ